MRRQRTTDPAPFRMIRSRRRPSLSSTVDAHWVCHLDSLAAAGLVSDPSPAGRRRDEPYVVRNDWQSRGLAMAAALTCYKKLAKLAS
ncbi:hypothetical protein AB5J55_41665 [Streptomyces sp. R11]|uniref:Uncharacterized protein n=1 Tax=Streptomyces sp. R11 TaxID=3238625 RepID=A0AB39NEX9_9ACTN